MSIKRISNNEYITDYDCIFCGNKNVSLLTANIDDQFISNFKLVTIKCNKCEHSISDKILIDSSFGFKALDELVNKWHKEHEVVNSLWKSHIIKKCSEEEKRMYIKYKWRP